MSDILEKYQKADHTVLKISYITAMCILLALAVWGGVKVYDFCIYEETNDAQVKEYINPILTRTNGFVQEIRYTDHMHVQMGDTLVVLDKKEATVRLHEVEAEIAAAEAQIKVLHNGVKIALSNANIYKAKINAAKAHLWKQQQDFDRYKNLLVSEAVTQQQFENIKTKLDIAQSDYDAMQSTLINSQDKIADEEAKLAVAMANLEQKHALLEKVKLNLQYTVITAPSDGFMGNKSIQPGQYVQTGQVIGFMVDKKQGKWIVANFQETQIAEMHEGQKAKILIDAFPDETFEGTITSFSPATGSEFSLLPTDNATGNYVKVVQRFPVKIEFDGKAMIEKLKAGMNAEVSVLKD